ncbi:DegT/DnrJ/EryC1/StrS family aminotransferase [Jannaschia seohaensis]|uniref:dTDP-4-amino-4,6-dideoxygalactose transaminase n=1 Tax=Jannaschia seohaensis TaxID=475081 RepID=A0A2Y9B318_9RHOB|nr:aminotransferase class I/II-fold pyridoxal phosphate-dependent enzyme [Jannaschia seohaensis]PWJ12453.1 dTDP-4-amino-4,6-dideoxygalactose transaminase [Jannaschia seohaensis]SSA50934.1 dTDP-4-amino-4,6-dideoxygalactose transaminase [Jannaschia seohaensis]
METFTKPFTRQEPIPEEGIADAVEVMRSGALHRYGAQPSRVAALEEAFAAQTGAAHALAVASGGYAMGCALRALGVGPGDPVLTNGWTLAPVPGAIAAVGARPILVEVTEDLVIDLDDLAAKADRAKVLMLSHMRGHIADMPALMAICDAHGIAVIEDCAHTMGAAWEGTPSGRWGAVGCYSCQTYKHVNSGEGGLIVTDDADLAARMILLSGSYMLYARNGTAPGEEVFARHKGIMPNVSGRMDELRAAILAPQIRDLPQQAERWNDRYRALEAGFRDAPGLSVIPRPQAEAYVGSSIQLLADDPARLPPFIEGCLARGVEWKWFGADQAVGFTSAHRHWEYVEAQSLPRTDAVLARLIDLRVPLTFDLEDCAVIARITSEEAARHLV